MKDAGFALQKAYYALLKNLKYKGKSVGVYSIKAPASATKPYIILGGWTGQPNNTKDGFGQTGEINVDVVSEFVGDSYSRLDSASIAEQATNLILPRPGVSGLTVEGFIQITTRIEQTQDIDAETSSGTLVRKIITVAHTLKQI